jgi:hypothetical protein
VVYNSRTAFDEGPTYADLQREADRAKRDAEAALKIEARLTELGVANLARTPAGPNYPNKINISYDMLTLVVQHRGYEIRGNVQDRQAFEPSFREWCAKEMGHAKVFPRKCSLQIN